jgi:hypothetical protein
METRSPPRLWRCSKVTASPDEYVQNYFDILQKMSQQEGAAQQRRWNAPKS